jgi:predicted transcriptional regulator
VKKTTVYLPEELKRRLERTARAQKRSEAEVIRAALDEFTARNRPRPKLPLFKGDGIDATIAERDEEILAEGFGRD